MVTMRVKLQMASVVELQILSPRVQFPLDSSYKILQIFVIGLTLCFTKKSKNEFAIQFN